MFSSDSETTTITHTRTHATKRRKFAFEQLNVFPSRGFFLCIHWTLTRTPTTLECVRRYFFVFGSSARATKEDIWAFAAEDVAVHQETDHRTTQKKHFFSGYLVSVFCVNTQQADTFFVDDVATNSTHAVVQIRWRRAQRLRPNCQLLFTNLFILRLMCVFSLGNFRHFEFFFFFASHLFLDFDFLKCHIWWAAREICSFSVDEKSTTLWIMFLLLNLINEMKFVWPKTTIGSETLWPRKKEPAVNWEKPRMSRTFLS